MAPRTNYRVNVVVNVKNRDHIDKLIKQLERLRDKAKEAPLKPLAKDLGKTQIEMRKFGRTAQNVSYQVQDMVVQISGGIDPLKSFGQQVPQMLVNFGALGAVIGVVAAGLPLMIDAFRDTGKVALDMSEAIGELNDATSGLETAIQNFMDEGSQFQLMLVELNRIAGERKLADYLDELNEQLSASNWEIWSQAASSAMSTVIARMKVMAAEQFPILAAMVKIAAAWTDVEVQLTSSGLAAAKANVELAKAAELFGVSEQAAENILRIRENYEATNKTFYDTRIYLRDLEDVLATSFAAGNTSADGLRKTVEELRASLNRLAGNPAFQEVTAQGRRTNASLGGGKGGEKDNILELRPDPDLLLFMDQAAEAQRANEAALREQQAAYDALFPKQARYAQVMEQIATIEKAGLGTTEDYIRLRKEAEEALNGEQFSLMAEAAELFNKSFDTMLDGILLGTRDIEDAFKDMAKVVIAQLLKMAAYKALAGFGGPIGDVAAGLLTKSAKGNVISGGNVVPFAKGGVVSSPTIFPMAKGAGLMGEAGPEAIMPLARTPGGELGVKSTGMSVTINNNAPGVEVRPRQTENGLTVDVVTRTLANSIRQGGNPLSDALEGSYSLSRGRGAY